MVGPYVSGKKKNRGQEAPAKMAPIQKAQLQDITEMNPDTTGPRIGPNVVAACEAVSGSKKGLSHGSILTIKIAMLLPRLAGL